MAVMANQACMVFYFFFCSSPGILRQPLHLARERDKHFGTFFVYVCLILGECRALWGERSEAWYRVTVAADAEAATYVKRVYVDYK